MKQPCQQEIMDALDHFEEKLRAAVAAMQQDVTVLQQMVKQIEQELVVRKSM